jgi:hypothetical protein
MSVVGDEPVEMLTIMSNPARALEMLDALEEAFADGEPDAETVGRRFARIDMELLAPCRLVDVATSGVTGRVSGSA